MNNTEILKVDNDWKLVKNFCRTSMKKDFTTNEATNEFKKKILISEHSPIRLINVIWKWVNIKYWVSTEWSRHKFEKVISSQRNDRQKNYDRNKAPQDSLVNFDGYANAQNLIDAWRKRLCYCATKEARELAEDFKIELRKKSPEISNVLVPNCVYRCGCPEFKPCGYFDMFKKYCKENNIDLTNIQDRYDAYNMFFYENKN